MRHRTRAFALSAAAAVMLAGCSGGTPNEGAAEEVTKLTFWTGQTTPERVTAQEEIAARFTAKTGIEVEVVPLAGPDQNTTLLANVASGEVPDVILHGWEQSASWVDQGILDQKAAAEVIAGLGEETFAEGAMRMIEIGGQPSGVPMDGWGYLYLYRSDLFEAAGLDAPKTIEDLAAAAEKLSTDGKGGIALGNQPGNAWLGETLEASVLPNGCQLVAGGEVTIDSPACVHALEVYQRMAATNGGAQFDVEAGRSAYLSGQASMLMFSSHILDEVAGLDEANPPTCPECKEDPGFLAQNTGVVTSLTGADGTEPVQFGTVLQLSIPTGAQTEAAKDYVEFLMTDGYVDSLAMATVGRVPVRLGTAENPTEYIDAWSKLPLGAGGQGGSTAEVYGDEVAQQVATGSENYVRWGAGTDDVLLASLVTQQQVVPQNIGDLFSAGDPAKVAEGLAAAAEAVQQETE
ncbi:ABC transporter substrate-binding protein [Nonomuraea sp. KM88]|uniref:ABC transporter substrate-binding protein n=1 Tax=Nonomuraea sp. KM88 TaxID=3457427 RepID=UPI003FCEAB7D